MWIRFIKQFKQLCVAKFFLAKEAFSYFKKAIVFIPVSELLALLAQCTLPQALQPNSFKKAIVLRPASELLVLLAQCTLLQALQPSMKKCHNAFFLKPP